MEIASVDCSNHDKLHSNNTGVDEERYPKRNIHKINYEEGEISDEDDYILCLDCEQLHKGTCPVHGPTLWIENTQVPNDGSVADRAERTLPGILRLNTANIKKAGLGIWANEFIPKGSVFGPYEGNIVQDGKEAKKSGYSWMVRKHEKVAYYIDGSDEKKANWLRYVNCANQEEHQNLIAFQYKEKLYYRAYKDIPPNCELLVWYGDGYAQDLGIDISKVKNPAPPMPDTDDHKCETCGKCFNTDTFLKAHKKKHNNKTVAHKFKCEICEYSTPYSTSFRRHENTHSGEKPHKCSQCDKGFTQKAHLDRHALIHTSKKPHKCTSCEKQFNNKSNLSVHMLVHSNERPHICVFCEKGFSHSGDLTKHERTHTGQRPFPCPDCRDRFRNKPDLTRHLKSRHPACIQKWGS